MMLSNEKWRVRHASPYFKMVSWCSHNGITHWAYEGHNRTICGLEVQSDWRRTRVKFGRCIQCKKVRNSKTEVFLDPGCFLVDTK